MSLTGDKNLDALYEIARLLNMPASSDSPAVAVVRGVREYVNEAERKIAAARDALASHEYACAENAACRHFVEDALKALETE